MADLFDPQDLASYLQQDLDTSTLERCRRVASGWLQAATGLLAWPSPVPDDLWTWAVELAAIAYDNPTGLQTDQVGGKMSTWTVTRRQEILSAAAKRYGPAPRLGGVGTPIGEFPDPLWYPDPAALTGVWVQ
jgi:hypothetical protein